MAATTNGAYDPFAMVAQSTAIFSTTQSPLTVRFDYTPGSAGSQGWLDWFEIHARVDLSMNGINQLLFRDWLSVGPGKVGSFIIKNASAATQVWDITEPLQPVRMQGAMVGSELRFVNECSRLHEYIVFNNTGYLTPKGEGAVPNQNLHGGAIPQYIIITHPAVLGQAQRLAQYHQQRDNLQSVVVTVNQVYNEFSSGSPDPAALRDYVKMFYDRAGGDSTKAPNTCCCLAMPRSITVPASATTPTWCPAGKVPFRLTRWQPIPPTIFLVCWAITTTLMEPAPTCSILALAAFPPKMNGKHESIVDKIIAYNDPKSLGPWRNECTFVADDEDNNLHLQDAEP